MSLDRPIYLVGMMGSGKTTVGRALAALHGLRFVDVDSEIESRAGCSIAEIFATRGESAFRKLEVETVRDLASVSTPRVISLGGGAVLLEETRTLLRRTGRCVWLQASPRELAARTSASGRPLLAGLALTEREQRLTNLLAERASCYEDAACVKVATENLDPLAIAQSIRAKLDLREPPL